MTATGASDSTAPVALRNPLRRNSPQSSNSTAARIAYGLLLAAALVAGGNSTARDLTFESAETVNEGTLHFLSAAPDRPVHHHQNHVRIHESSLTSGWVSLAQCHDHLDAVPRAQITFREGYVRDLRVESSHRIEQAWVEGPSVQLVNVEPGARLCLAAETRAFRNTGKGYFNLSNGPYMRKFLDGYYPMRVTLKVDYPADLLTPIDIDPPAQPGLTVEMQPGMVQLDALFEGELQTLIQFETP